MLEDLFSYTTDPARSQIFGFWLDGVPECVVYCLLCDDGNNEFILYKRKAWW